MSTVQRVRDLVAPEIERDGAEIYDIEHSGGVLRISVDRPGGIDVDSIGELSTRISRLLDAHDPVPDSRYMLEVSSPGIERKLRTPDHFSKQLGKEISVKLAIAIDGVRRAQGIVQSATEDSVTLSISNENQSADQSTEASRLVTYSFSDIESAHAVFNWQDAEASNQQSAQESKSAHKHANKQTKTANKKASER